MRLLKKIGLLTVAVPRACGFIAPIGFNAAALGQRCDMQQRIASTRLSCETSTGAACVEGMSASGRLPLIVGNWKMNPLSETAARGLAKQVAHLTVNSKDVEVAIIPPYPYLIPAKEEIDQSPISTVTVGAQNVDIQNSGAFTGGVSTAMLASAGLSYVLCGHSERRVVFGDTDEIVNHKVNAVLKNNLKVILCIGENKNEYEDGLNKQVCSMQLEKALAGVTVEQMKNVVIAYEPVWAIGTGLTATPDVAQSVHAYIRSWIEKKYGPAVANAVRIQYGGSVTPNTVDELMACPDIDGALVGGASLVPEKFSRIVRFK